MLVHKAVAPRCTTQRTPLKPLLDLSRCLTFALLAAALLPAYSARADDDPKARAREAYARGEKLAANKDLEGAAAAFAEADWYAPNPTALEAALEATIRADAPALGMNLVERASRSPADLAIPAVRTARERFATRVGVLTFPCREESKPCKPIFRGAPVMASRVWALPGNYEVQFEGASKAVLVDLGAGAERRVDPPAPEPAPVVTKPREVVQPVKDAGISPLWTILPAGVTVVSGGMLLASILQVGAAESDLETFQLTENPGAGATPAQKDAFAQGQNDIIDEGETWSTMAGVFGGLTAAAGAATIIVLVIALSSEPDEVPQTVGYLLPVEGGFSAGLSVTLP
jgi:hypothetical protein